MIDTMLETMQIAMKTASVSDLTANLYRYLREVRRGTEVQVIDRGEPIARLVPVTKDGRNVRDRLIDAGILRPGKGRTAAILDQPPLSLPTSLSEVLDEDRTDRL